MKVFVIGSLSQSEEIKMVADKYKRMGHNVDYAKQQPGEPFGRIVENVFANIQNADLIAVVLKPDGTIGDGTTYEMVYAESLGKPVKRIQPILDIDFLLNTYMVKKYYLIKKHY